MPVNPQGMNIFYNFNTVGNAMTLLTIAGLGAWALSGRGMVSKGVGGAWSATARQMGILSRYLIFFVGRGLASLPRQMASCFRIACCSLACMHDSPSVLQHVGSMLIACLAFWMRKFCRAEG
jgi:hypothetical protein